MSEVTVYYLEMTDPAAINGKPAPVGLRIEEATVKQYQYNRFFYQLVGGAWGWTDKLSWRDEQWQTYAENDDLRLWAAFSQGSPAGYYELHKQSAGNVELCYFGLAAQFIGRGFGGHLLTHALQSAWAWEGTRRVWVHTCSLDHPSALRNYQARGMTLYRTEIEA